MTSRIAAPRRWSHVATAAFVGSMAAVVALHVLRPDLDPVRRRLSEYAVGRFGGLMTAAFVLLGLGLYALSRGVRAAGATTPATRVLRVLLSIAAIGMIVSGVFETRPVTPPGWREIVHSRASALAFVALITAAVWTATVAREVVAWGATRGVADAVAAIATLGAVIGPLAHDGPWAGMVQRMSYVAVLCWLLLAAAATARTRPPRGDRAARLTRVAGDRRAGRRAGRGRDSSWR